MTLARILILLVGSGLVFGQGVDSLVLLPAGSIRAVSTDPQGNLLAAWQNGSALTISRYSADGQLMQSFASGQPGNFVTVLACDPRGIIYLSAGTTLVRFGDDPGTGWQSGLPASYAPGAIGFDSSNNVIALVTTWQQHLHVVKLDKSSGKLLSDADLASGTTAGTIAVDADGAVYAVGMTDSSKGISGFAAKLDPTLQKQVYFTLLDGARPTGIAVDSTGVAFVAEVPLEVGVADGVSGGSIHFGTNMLYKLDPSGAIAASAPGGGNAIALDANGNLVVTGGSYPRTGAFQTTCGPRTDLGGLSVSLLDPTTLQSKASAFLAQQILKSASPLRSDGTLYVATQSGRILHASPSAPSSPVACIVNGASYLAENSVAPGQLITIFGRGLGTDPITVFDDSKQLPFSSNGTEVHISNLPAALLAVSSTQVNAIVPYGINDLNPQLPFALEVLRDGKVIYTWQLSGTVRNPSPFLAFDSNGGLDFFQSLPLAFVRNQDGSANSATNPAPLGSTVTIYATGFGHLGGAAAYDGAPASTIVPQWPILPPIIDITTQIPVEAPAEIPVSTPNGNLTLGFLPITTIPGHSNSLLQVTATIPANFPPGPLPFVIGNSTVWTNFLYTR